MMNSTELCELFFKYRSDKCPTLGHTYSPVYHETFKEIKESAKIILEIGVGSHEVMKRLCGEDYIVGASLFAWRDFFTNSQVFGLDLDPTAVFETNKIKCFQADQSSSPSLEKSIDDIKNYLNDQTAEFDLILDDGSHVIEHMILSFETLGKYVKTGGFYVIEDIQSKDLTTFLNLNIDGFKIFKVHRGDPEYSWDNTILYKKQ